MTGKTNTGLQKALELGPILGFVVAYIFVREETFTIGGTEYDGFILLTGLLIPVLAATNFALWKLTGKVSRIQLVTLVFVAVFGALTVWFNDERFYKMRSTLVFGLFGGLLWIGLMRGQSWLEYVLEGMMPITHEGWMALTRRLAWFFLAMAIANEIIWRSFSTDIYVVWDTFGQMGAMFAFFMSQARLLERHWVEEG